MATVDIDLGGYQLGWHDEVELAFEPRKGLDEDMIRDMSAMKGEPEWMLEFRLKSYQRFLKRPIPQWGGGGLLNTIDFDDIYYYVKPEGEQQKDWDMVPESIKETYEKLGIPEAERKYLAGVTAQYDSETVYHRNREELEKIGVLFTDMDTAVAEYPEIVQEYLGTIIPPNDNKFAALNSAVWSGGSFIYVPPGVTVEQPLQAYFRINSENMGQFERTLIIVDEGAFVNYIEGCLPAGEQVVTAAGGRIPIEDVKVGDQVLTHEGRPVRVNSIQIRDYTGPMYTFVPVSPDNAFRVTEEHPLLVVPRHKVGTGRKARGPWKPEVSTAKLLDAEAEWTEAKDVAEGDFMVFPKPRPEPADVLLVDELATLAGYYLADGSASLVNGHKALQFSFHIDDTESVDEVRRACKYLYDAEGSVYWNDKKNEARVLVYTVPGYEAMKNHVGTRSHTKQLSDDFLRQDEVFLSHLVDAYIRGDGNITERGDARWVRASTTSRTWAHQLQAVLARLGTYATIRLQRPGGPAEILGRKVNRHDLYTVQWTMGGSGPREVRDAGDHFLVPIKKIEVEEFEGLVHNLDVSDPDSYLASGFAVHNCSAPVYTTDSLHAAVVEVVVKEGGRCRYTTIQNWSNNVFNLVTKRAAAYRNATMEWVDGNIGCLAEGSLVTTRSGPTPIELIQPGQEVMSWDERSSQFVWSTATAKRYSGDQPVREVRTGERRIRVTDNHPFFSYKYDPERARKLGRYKLGFVRADELSEAIVPRTSLDFGEPVKLSRPDTESVFATKNQYKASFKARRVRKQRLAIPAFSDDDVMWLLGLFVGDGSIDSEDAANGSHRWSKVVFSVPESDRARGRLMQVMGRLMPDTDPTLRADGVAATWNSVELAEFLESNGFESGARRKRLPQWVLDLPESQRLSLVAGLLDSDGCAPKGKRGFSIKSVNRHLLEDVAGVLTSLGIPARIHTEHEEIKPVTILGYDSVSRGAHVIVFPVDDRLMAHVSDDLAEAASAQPEASLKWFRRVGRSNIELPESVEIRKVDVSEPIETVPTWDIEVAGTGNFVAEGFIVHNSRLTMKYPAVWLMEPGAHGEVLSIAFAGEGMHQDAGAKMVHVAPDTTSTIVSKSICKDGGRAGYRGLVRVEPGAENSKSFVRCDALILDENSRSDTYPYMEIEENDAEIGHEATVSKVGEEQLFYLMSRGLTEDQATSMIVAGFIEPIIKELPMEYAVEMNRLIELNMAAAGAVG